MPVGEPKGCDDGDAKISEIQGENSKSATRKEVAITMLGPASIDNNGSEEHAGEDEEEGRAESVVDLESDEVEDDGGLGAASQMVQHDESNGEETHPVERRNMFGSCVPLNYADHAYSYGPKFVLVQLVWNADCTATSCSGPGQR